MTYYEGLLKMARAAELLEQSADRKRFLDLASSIAAAFNAKWSDEAASPGSGSYCRGSQTATAMALALGVSQDGPKSLSWLLQSIRANNNHSLCGEIGWPYVVRSLKSGGDEGNVALAAITSRTDSPSYGYQLAQGATTLTESWTASRRVSWNHAMDGHIDAWFYEHVAGLRSTRPLRLVPRPFPGLSHAEASRLLPSGRTHLSWELDDGSLFRVQLLVPPGATAHLELPASAEAITVADVAAARHSGLELVEGSAASSRWTVQPGTYRLEMQVAAQRDLVV